jgi:hypothetical protein
MIAVVLGVLILLASSVLWLQSRASQRYAFILSDGSTLTFQQATFGTNHTVSTAARWTEFVPRIFTRWLNSTLPPSSFTTESPVVVLWFEHQRAPGNGPDYACSLVHPDGTETAFEGIHFFARSTRTNSLTGVPSAYPRREKVLRFRVYEKINYNDVTPLGEFTLRNPNILRVPRKSAPPLPQTAHDGDLEVTLISLKANATESRLRKTNFLNQWTQARFLVQEKGAPTRHWGPQQMVAVDSVGNKITSRSTQGRAEQQYENFECQPVLWPSETYKLRFEFSRKADALFETNEIWTIPGIAVPASGEFSLVNTQKNLAGFNVLFHGVTTPGASPPWQEMMGGSQSIGFSISPEPKEYRFTLVRVTDDAGKAVEMTGAGYSNTNWGFGMRLKDSTKRIDVTVALHRSRFVQFEVQPSTQRGSMQ